MKSRLNDEELTRYARHIVLPEVTAEGQMRLKAASVLLVGLGGLGSPAAIYLAAAGVGRLGLVDADRVDVSNLQRQVLYGSGQIGKSKVEMAAERIRELNPHVRVDCHKIRLTSRNAMEIAREYDLLVDGADNFATRYLVNDAAVLLKKPNVHGAVSRFEGQVSVYAPCLGGPCYRCLHPEPPPPGRVQNCADAGVLGVLPGLIGTMQATEAIKLILGVGHALTERLLIFDALGAKFREMKIRRDPQCPACGEKPSITRLIDYETACPAQPPNSMPNPDEITVQELKQRLDAKEDFDIVDVRDPDEWEICNLPGARLIPLGELPKRLKELNPSREIVVHCKMGGRGGKAMKLLKEKGFAKVRNLAGGIMAWASQIDPAMRRY
jgi:adenylyltransferase/sulfurtransferase